MHDVLPPPNMLLSGVLLSVLLHAHGPSMWARPLPVTHYVRIVRAIILQGSSIADLQVDSAALVALMVVR